MATCALGGRGMSMEPLVSLENLTLAYHRQPAVHHLNGSFMRSELVAVAGSNGAGKSTLLKAIAGILPVFEGGITFHGITRQDTAYLPQMAEMERDFPINVLQLVSSGFWRSCKGFRRISRAQQQSARDALEAVGLKGFETRAIDSLSSGQFQRALFARLLVQDAQLILLDEPFSAIDSTTTAALLGIIHRWQEEGRTVICVLHDFEMIKAHFPRCLLLARECVAWGASQEVLTPENLLGARFFRAAPAEAVRA